MSHLFGLTAVSVLFIRNVSELPMPYSMKEQCAVQISLIKYCGENVSFLGEICCFYVKFVVS